MRVKYRGELKVESLAGSLSPLTLHQSKIGARWLSHGILTLLVNEVRFIYQAKNRRCAMKKVKQLLFVVLIGLVMGSVARAGDQKSQTPAPGMIAVYHASFPTTLKSGEYEMQTVLADFPQGVGVANHMHGGYVLVTVLNGEMTLKEKGGERIIRAGESWTENPGDVHSVVNAGTATARVVINMLLPKGAESTTIIK